MIVSGYGHTGFVHAAKGNGGRDVEFKGRVRSDVLLSRYTVWGVGGPARRFFEPFDLDDLARFLRQLDSREEIFWLGLGSNLLVRDAGLDGTVIRTVGLAKSLVVTADGAIRSGAGVPCPQVARFTANHGFQGAEFLAGIPGTLGGALAMNAGAFGGETWDIVRRVEVMRRDGSREWLSPDAFQVTYRQVVAPDDTWFTQAVLVPYRGDGDAAARRIRELLAQRAASQPSGERSCGSVFRNPPGDHAGRLIEACDLKGYRVGGAQVSEKHANFIINTGTATAADIEALMAHVMATVKARQGVKLIPEVRIVGQGK